MIILAWVVLIGITGFIIYLIGPFESVLDFIGFVIAVIVVMIISALIVYALQWSIATSLGI